MSCCQNKLYNDAFDLKRARKELEDYRLKGPKKNSLPLINKLKELNINHATLLDIGSGVGAVIFELFEYEIAHATYNDFSTAYTEAFQEEIKRRSLDSQIECFTGDFLESCKNIKAVDLVCLDKVICCYKNYKELVDLSTQKAKKWYAYSVPRDIWWVKVIHFLEQKLKWIKGNPFRTYVHPVNKIEKIIEENGFKKINDSHHSEWQTVIFERKIEKGRRE